MIVVFVSKNDEEFTRYLNDPREVIRGSLSFCPDTIQTDIGGLRNVSESSKKENYDPLDDESARTEAESYQATMKRYEKNISVEYMFPVDSLVEFLKKDLFVIVVRSGQEINLLKEQCKKEQYCGRHTAAFMALIADVIRNALPKREMTEDDGTINHVVYLLVHWGELYDPEYEEDVFNQAIKKAHYEKNVVHCKNLTVREISSRRPCFDVQKSCIAVPCKKDDVEALLKRFELAQAFSGIKNDLTKFVVREFSKLTSEEQSQIVCFFASNAVRSDFRSSMNDPQVKWLKKWKAFQEYLEAKPDKENPDKVKGKALAMLQSELQPDKENARRFVTQLLTIPQLLSEGLLA